MAYGRSILYLAVALLTTLHHNPSFGLLAHALYVIALSWSCQPCSTMGLFEAMLWPCYPPSAMGLCGALLAANTHVPFHGLVNYALPWASLSTHQ